jgi:hypothetical protein
MLRLERASAMHVGNESLTGIAGAPLRMRLGGVGQRLNPPDHDDARVRARTFDLTGNPYAQPIASDGNDGQRVLPGWDLVRVQRQGKNIPRPILFESNLAGFKLKCH